MSLFLSSVMSQMGNELKYPNNLEQHPYNRDNLQNWILLLVKYTKKQNTFNQILPNSLQLSLLLSVFFSVWWIVLINTPASPSNTPSSSNILGRKQTQSPCQLFPLYISLLPPCLNFAKVLGTCQIRSCLLSLLD